MEVRRRRFGQEKRRIEEEQQTDMQLGEEIVQVPVRAVQEKVPPPLVGRNLDIERQAREGET